jgi:hypothetical protein
MALLYIYSINLNFQQWYLPPHPTCILRTMTCRLHSGYGCDRKFKSEKPIFFPGHFLASFRRHFPRGLTGPSRRVQTRSQISGLVHLRTYSYMYAIPILHAKADWKQRNGAAGQQAMLELSTVDPQQPGAISPTAANTREKQKILMRK